MAYIAAPSHSIVYLNMPKAACTSIKCWLYALEYGKTPSNPLDIHRMINRDLALPSFKFTAKRNDFEKYFKKSYVFTFVRHPLKRAYSLFNEKIVGESTYSWPRVKEIIEEEYSANFKNPRNLENEQNNFLSFMQFILDNYKRKSNFRRDHHWLPQVETISHNYHIRLLDFIGRVENIKEDSEYIFKKIGKSDISIPHLNEGDLFPFTYNQVITPKIKEIGEEVYYQDLRNFAYEL